MERELVSVIKNNLKGKKLNDFLRLLNKNDGYCPCSTVKNEDTKCVCKEFRDMGEGICHCGLFIKKKDE